MEDSDNAEAGNFQLPFDIEIQYHILKMMTASEHFLIKCSTYLKQDYFENSVLGWFFETISKHYDDYKKLIEEITIKNEILRFDAKDRIRYEKAFEKIFSSTYSDEQYLREQLTGWLRSRKFMKLYEDVAELYNSGQRESAYEVTSKAITDLKQLDLTSDNTIKFTDIESIIANVAKTAQNRIPTGIKDIDNAMLGGLPKQTLTTVLGSTNVGKSIMLINMAYNAIRAGHKVLIIYHEGQDDQMSLRIMSRFTGIPYMKFYGGLDNLSEIERERISMAKVILDQNLMVRPWQKFGTTVEEIISYARQKKSDFDFDMIIDDYAQLLYTRHAVNEVRHNQATVYRGLSAMAAELNVVAVTAAQGNRLSHSEAEKGKKLLGLTDIAECFEIVRCSEAVITLTKSQQDQVNGQIKIMLAKQRDGAVNIAVNCNTDLKRLIMYDEKLGITPLRVSDSQEIIDEPSTTGVSSRLSS